LNLAGAKAVFTVEPLRSLWDVKQLSHKVFFERVVPFIAIVLHFVLHIAVGQAQSSFFRMRSQDTLATSVDSDCYSWLHFQALCIGAMRFRLGPREQFFPYQLLRVKLQ